MWANTSAAAMAEISRRSRRMRVARFFISFGVGNRLGFGCVEAERPEVVGIFADLWRRDFQAGLASGGGDEVGIFVSFKLGFEIERVGVDGQMLDVHRRIGG